MYSTAYITVLQQVYKTMVQMALLSHSPEAVTLRGAPSRKSLKTLSEASSKKIPQTGQNVLWALLFSRILPALIG